MCGLHSHIFPNSPVLAVSIHLPDWVETLINWQQPLVTDEAKMSLALSLAQENVRRKTGGPFASIIVHRQSGLLLSIGVNQVVPQNNSTLHGEVMAIMLGEQRLKQYSLGLAEDYELFTSCEPCAMCMGAILWSGVKRLVCAATGEDARAIGFDEGPVFEASYDYLIHAGIKVERQVLQRQGREILQAYVANGGLLYNGAE
ncbi:nucleoside deaminase [Shewanella yunxiaonensis]|uniref:Nucleoside deaminase n=1 Tax=Shewanella yunxiaonensis TaxID=2829809 RepID=A0ABX7YQF9_9GAMM|nr:MULTISPECIES: nucleoside deaminase [Shewanella]MDF0533731.1 nucleoside deaminase [Shewanella sp. A32]QUN04937.1 nucleoside deaminase [Shewanella yunxiaonensis]